MKKLAMKMLSLLLVLSLLLPTCVFAQPGQDGDGTPGTQGAAMENADTPTGGGNSDGDADTPAGGGNGNENADTSTGGGNGEDVDVPTGGGNGDGNGDETSKDENGGGNGDETTKDENGDENADVSEEEAAPTVVEMEEVVLDLSDMDLPDNDELFAAYVEREFDRAAGGTQFPVFYSSSHATYDLTTAEKLVYNELKSEIEKIADGTRTNTVIATTNPFCYTWTASDLGVSGPLWSSGTPTSDARTAAGKKAEEQVSKMWSRLLADCPYELYWCDKRSVPFTLAYSNDGGNLKVAINPIQLKVAKEYSVSGAAGTSVTNGKPSLVTDAVNNAQNIVNTYNASGTTYTAKEKMKGYKDEICALVSYNDAAAGSSDYGDPWQMIYVFDNDPTTKVVCEGYAKAFQYLCEKSTPQIKCYNVTGTMGGNHMWNVVEVGNARYLVDVTNCDEGMIGYSDNLFLKAVNSTDGGKTYDFSFGSQTVTYVYGTDMEDLFCAGYPTLRALQSIAITTPPSKTTYAQGENFDATGMVVTATYSDGSSTPVTDYTVEGGKPFASSDTSVTIKYAELDNEKATTQTVTVTDKPELKGSVTIDKTSPKIGDTLTANTGSLNYNGATAGTLSYQWKAGGVEVGTGNTYTVKVGDYNKKITVTVTNPNNTGSVSSAETAAVVKKDGPSAPAAPVVKDATAVGFTYTAIAGQQYAISTNSVSPADSEWGDVVTTGGDKVVTGKNANTEYYVYTRYAETEDTYAGAASGGTKVKTRMSAAASQFIYSTKEAVYTGSANGASVTSSVHNSSEFTLKYNGADTAPTNVGKYTLTAVVTAHGDYAATTVELGMWEIKPLEVTLTWNNTGDRTYDGNNSNVTATVNNTKGADEVNVTVTGGTEANAGNHTATAAALTGAAAGNYKLPDTKPTKAYTITAATIAVGTDAFKDLMLL